MTVTIARVAVVLALILGIALGVQTWRLNRAAAREVEARAKIQAEQLLAAGWQATAHASQAELARIVPALEAEIAAAKKAGTTVAGSSHWAGHGSEIPVPCTVVMGPPAGTTLPTSDSPPPTSLPEAPLTVAVTPHVRIDDAVALDDAGGIYVARHVQARLSVGETWASEWGPVTADPGSTTAVDPRIGAAWRAYLNPSRPPWEIRLGIGVPGPTVRVGATWPLSRRFGVWGDVAAPVTPGGEFAAGAGVSLRVP